MILVILFIAITLSGCTETDGTSDTSNNLTKHKEEASQKLITAEENRQKAQNAFNQLKTKVSEVQKRGVTTSKTSKEVDTLKQDLQSADSLISTANTYFRQRQYQLSGEKSENAIERAQDVIDGVERAQMKLEQEYQQAIESSKQRLEAANKEYHIAAAYLNAAQEEGTNTSALADQLNQTHNTLKTGVEAITGETPIPKQANDRAEESIQLSQNIQTQAAAAAKREIATDRIKEVSDRLSSFSAEEQVDAAKSAASTGQFSRAEEKLLSAQFAEQLYRYEQFVETINQSAGIELRSLQRQIQKAQMSIRRGTISRTTLNRTRTEIGEVSDCLDAIRNANNAIAQAHQASNWIVNANVSEAAKTRDVAEKSLSAGSYAAACGNASTAQRLARSEKGRIEAETSSSMWISALDMIYGVLQRTGITGKQIKSSLIPENITPSRVRIRPVEIRFSPPQDVGVQPLDFASKSIEAPTFPENTGEDTAPEPSVGLDASHEITECGWKCRNVNGTIMNIGEKAAHDVWVGVNITSNGKIYWEDSASLGTLEPGESQVQEKTIELGLVEAYEICDNGYYRVHVVVVSVETGWESKERETVECPV